MEEKHMLPRQQYSRELKIAGMREIGSRRSIADVALMDQCQ